mmetsp:Transcript_115856/g.236855  ORF Transcript_115856/g.236855 Transcript_115856/m.236855 type:complete len:96 (+) Transcript_115856:1200-1487(+)
MVTCWFQNGCDFLDKKVNPRMSVDDHKHFIDTDYHNRFIATDGVFQSQVSHFETIFLKIFPQKILTVHLSLWSRFAFTSNFFCMEWLIACDRQSS